MCSINYASNKELLRQIRGADNARFEELSIDGIDILEDDLPDNGDQISFRLVLPAGSASKFHTDLYSFLESTPKISRGELPKDYYLVEEDYYSEDIEIPDQVDTLSRICRLIIGLSDLAHYHDGKLNNGCLRLVFIHPDQGPGIKPIELETRVSRAVINAATGLDPALVEDLSSSSAPNDPHHSAKVGVFGTSLATFIANKATTEDSFTFLVSHWKDFVAEYHRDLGTYLSGFAFHKAKTEIAEAQLKIADEFSKVLTDITGKLLGIPVTLAVVIAIPRTDTLLERLLLLLGVFIGSLIMSKTVANQQRQFRRIVNAKRLVIGAIEGKKETYPSDLAKEIDRLGISLADDESGLRNCLRFFRALSWLPLAISVYVFGYIYWETISPALPLWLKDISVIIDEIHQYVLHLVNRS